MMHICKTDTDMYTVNVKENHAFRNNLTLPVQIPQMHILRDPISGGFRTGKKPGAQRCLLQAKHQTTERCLNKRWRLSCLEACPLIEL